MSLKKVIGSLRTGLKPQISRYAKSYKMCLGGNLRKFLRKEGYSDGTLKRLGVSEPPPSNIMLYK